jgi:predicted transcriptional regulator
MAKRPPDLTGAEFDVMKALWRLKQGSVAEIRAEHAALFESDLAYTTVMTLLGRLATKGAVHVDKSRQPYSYRPAFRRESVLRDRLRKFVDNVFDGQADSLVLQLLEAESLSLDELRSIEQKVAAEEDDE